MLLKGHLEFNLIYLLLNNFFQHSVITIVNGFEYPPCAKLTQMNLNYPSTKMTYTENKIIEVEAKIMKLEMDLYNLTNLAVNILNFKCKVIVKSL